MLINDGIRELKERLYFEIFKYEFSNLNKKEVLSTSQELDKLIVEYMKKQYCEIKHINSKS